MGADYPCGEGPDPYPQGALCHHRVPQAELQPCARVLAQVHRPGPALCPPRLAPNLPAPRLVLQPGGPHRHCHPVERHAGALVEWQAWR
eukprot:7500420-Lingulodinium_polyedra.AAC.2